MTESTRTVYGWVHILLRCAVRKYPSGSSTYERSAHDGRVTVVTNIHLSRCIQTASRSDRSAAERSVS